MEPDRPETESLNSKAQDGEELVLRSLPQAVAFG